MKRTKNAGVSLPAELMDQIDNERQDVPRSRYILRILEKALIKEINSSQPMNPNSNAKSLWGEMK